MSKSASPRVCAVDDEAVRAFLRRSGMAATLGVFNNEWAGSARVPGCSSPVALPASAKVVPESQVQESQSQPLAQKTSRTMTHFESPPELYSEARQTKKAVRRMSAREFLKTAYERISEIDAARKWLIMPGGWFSTRWDMVLIVALLFTTVITPYEVALLPVTVNGMFVLNRIVDLVFLVDIWVNMNLMFTTAWNPDAHVNNRRAIRLRYLKGWFFIDFVSLIPFDLIGMGTSGQTVVKVQYESTGLTSQTFRLIRCLRLLKMVRIVRASRVFTRWEFHLGLIHTTLMSYKLLFGLVVMSHWFACAWCMMAFLQPPAEYSWATAWLDGIPGLPQRCLSVTAATAATSHNVLNGAYRATCFEHDEMYVAALHFAVQSVTSIGYGDIVATNHFERSCTVVLMLVSAIGWAWIIGNIVSIASMSAPVEVLYHEKVDLITAYMEKMNIAQSHRIKVRRFLSFSKFAMKVIWHGKHRKRVMPNPKRVSPVIRRLA
jgi:hypothetical protein